MTKLPRFNSPVTELFCMSKRLLDWIPLFPFSHNCGTFSLMQDDLVNCDSYASDELHATPGPLAMGPEWEK